MQLKNSHRKKNDCNAALIFIFRHRTPIFLLVAFVGLCVIGKWASSLSLVKDDSVVWIELESFINDGGNDMNKIKNNQASSASVENHLLNPTTLTASNLPIHIIHPSANHLSVLPWITLASIWDRHTQFQDIIRISRKSALPQVPPNHRIIIIIHCAPKMGSLTLRDACRNDMLNSCGVRPGVKKDPKGYFNMKDLDEVIHGCTDTTHFCVRNGVFSNQVKDVKRSDKTVFFHLYPFRNYDEWTVSALKQPYDRGGVRLCNRLRDALDKCEDRHGELNFKKYPKATMSQELHPLVARRINEMRESHHVVLYPFWEIDALLSVLSDVYHIPLLPGSNATAHKVRLKDGTCDQSILDQFHECFTSKLAKLP